MMAASRDATLNFLKQRYGKKLKTTKNDVSLVIDKGKSISGATSISKHLLRTSEEFKGLSLEDRLSVEQWLEFSPGLSSLEATGDREKLRVVLQDLNVYLQDKVYFASTQLTIADVLLFYNLYPIFERMTFLEKEKLINVARWFNHIQQDDKALQSLAPLKFLRTMLYDGAGHH